MRKRSSIILALIIFLLVLSGCNISESAVSQGTEKNAASENYQKKENIISFKTYSLAQLQEDFQQFQKTIEMQHPMLFTNKEELPQLFKTQYQLLYDNMEEIEFYRVLSPIVTKLNCGHTSVSFSKEFGDFISKSGKYLPLSLKIIDNKAYVYQNPLSSDIPVGSEVISINGKSIKDIIGILINNISADGSNTSRKYYIVNSSFRDMYFNYIDTPDNFTVTYKAASSNETLKTTVAAATKEQIKSANNSLNFSTKQDDGSYFLTFEKDYAVLRIKSFAFYDETSRNKFKSFIDESFSNLADRNISNLILDLRDNWGGDPYCSAYLFSYLIKEAKPYFSSESSGNFYSDLMQPITPSKNNFQGKIYTLINGASFSSTGHLCALLKYYKIGTFLGEESGGSYVCTDSSQDITLKNTKLKFHCATTPWKVAVSGLTPGRGIIPDYTITPTIQDYINGKDTVKEYTIDLIRNN